MKIARFEHQGKILWGSVHEDTIYVLTGDINLITIRLDGNNKNQGLFLQKDMEGGCCL
jgi:hypothetical protein